MTKLSQFERIREDLTPGENQKIIIEPGQMVKDMKFLVKIIDEIHVSLSDIENDLLLAKSDPDWLESAREKLKDVIGVIQVA